MQDFTSIKLFGINYVKCLKVYTPRKIVFGMIYAINIIDKTGT